MSKRTTGNDAPGGDIADDATAGRKRGRAAFAPDDQQRAQVKELIAGGATHPAAAKAIGVSVATLRKHFPDELVSPVPLLDANRAAGVVKPVKRRSGRKGGRKAFKPLQEQRQRVQVLSASGMPDAEIAVAIGISPPTLRKHFAAELRQGSAVTRAETVYAVYRKAKSGVVAAQRLMMEMLDVADVARREAAFDAATAPDRSATRGRASKASKSDDRPGKKAQENLDALTASDGTEWAAVLDTMTPQ